jgi:hypothetical protein
MSDAYSSDMIIYEIYKALGHYFRAHPDIHEIRLVTMDKKGGKRGTLVFSRRMDLSGHYNPGRGASRSPRSLRALLGALHLMPSAILRSLAAFSLATREAFSNSRPRRDGPRSSSRLRRPQARRPDGRPNAAPPESAAGEAPVFNRSSGTPRRVGPRVAALTPACVASPAARLGGCGSIC